MEFIVAFNDKLMRRMVFYKSVPEEAFNYKQFRSTKSLIQKIVLEGCFKTKAVTGKKDVLKKSTLLLLLTNTKNSIAVWDKKSVLKIKKDTIINVKSELSSRSLYNFIKRWFFLFNPFLFENEISSFTGPKSIKKK
jgi:ribosomal protein L5